MKSLSFASILISTFLLVTSCNNDDDTNTQIPISNSPDTWGIGYSESDEAASDIYNSIISTLNANENINIVTEVNHSQNAQNAGLELDFTRTVYFGNPNLGTPILQDNIKAGLDLPQRITVYTDSDNNSVVAYNSIDYVINRHGIIDVSTKEMIENALESIVTSATGTDVMLNPVEIQDTDGIIYVASENDFNTTYSKIINTINSLEPVSIMAELDHQANAQSVDMELRPAKLIIFGNPILGTPLMSESRTTALDLPQKMLIFEDEYGGVQIIYNDPNSVAERHNITNNDEVIGMISQALETIANSGAVE